MYAPVTVGLSLRLVACCEQVEGGDGAAHPVLAALRSRSGLQSLYKALQGQAAAHRQALVARLQSQLTHLLANALGQEGASEAEVGAVEAEAGGSSGSNGSHRSPFQLRRRSVAHCLRALCALGVPEVAEDLVRSTAVSPFVK